MYDSAGDDALTAESIWAAFSGSDFYRWTQGFDYVNAYSDAGGSDSKEIGAVDFVLRTHGEFWLDA